MATDALQVRPIENVYDFYVPLDRSRKEIRHVLLYPTNQWPEITLGFVTVSIKEQPVAPYECLSYHWGGMEDTRTVTLRYRAEGHVSGMKEQQFRVTANLESALRHLRHKDDFRTMWIDAISINQSDTEERTQQAAMMAEVFSNAERVVIWLADMKYTLDPQVLTSIDALVEEIKQLTDLGHDEILGSHSMDIASEELRKSMPRFEDLDEGRRTRYREMFDAVSLFLGLPWFERVWVLQEVFYSSSSTWVQYGEWRTHWEFIVLAVYWQIKAGLSYQDFPIDVNVLPELWHEIASAGKNKGLKILDILFIAGFFHASDPRDKIYALLSLAEDTSQIEGLPPNMRPDYARSIVEFSTNPKYFRFDNMNLPTWVPNYYEGRSVSTTILGRKGKFRASAQSQVSMHSSALEGSLCVEGVQYDKVAGVLPAKLCNDHVNLRDAVTESLVHAVRVLWSFVNENLSRPYPTGEYILDVYISTLVCNLDKYHEYEEPLDTHSPGNLIPQPTHNADMPPPSRSVGSNRGSSTSSSAPTAQAETSRAMGPTSVYAIPEDPQIRALAPDSNSHYFGILASSFCYNRTFFVTEKGYLGLGPKLTQVGDQVVLLAGGRVPFILSIGPDEGEPEAEADTETKDPGSVGGDGRANHPWFNLIGECYVHGIMYGSAWEEAERKRDEFPLRAFDIR
ncbi:hypothetical protein H2201_002820 [Coniosporium apollinis]|uniref:Heterokaryon incompatibility domain-containing protein n=1 Tax=Coniosporium apollinis TaxID=61459 RepID=A0ABQ9NY02_9PEZI|nr:hypothetical protein H2201_002820 [Coniosporium apollinis]